MINEKDIRIGIIGLGYVGLPLAIEFGKFYNTIGFDINPQRVNELVNNLDSTFECSKDELLNSKYLSYTTNEKELDECNIYIITVPTPVDESNKPNLKPLIKASETIGRLISKKNIVIYESTVYPGATEEDCVPVIEKISGLKLNIDFCVGYSPERINPGDKKHRLSSIKKVTSGSNIESAKFINNLYAKIITAGTFLASSIKTAEAAKVIENTQRDINIALINELSLIFNKIGIDTLEVLEAAESKWNFLPFRPGLVGGHCIGVDPYYLTYKAEKIGYHPEIILSGRRLNDSMAQYIASECIKLMMKNDIIVKKSKVLIMGLTFKENCPDIRNTKVVDLIKEFEEYECNITVFDPCANSDEVLKKHNISLISNFDECEHSFYELIVLTVAHNDIKKIGAEKIRRKLTKNGVLYDVKYLFDRKYVDGRI